MIADKPPGIVAFGRAKQAREPIAQGDAAKRRAERDFRAGPHQTELQLRAASSYSGLLPRALASALSATCLARRSTWRTITCTAGPPPWLRPGFPLIALPAVA